MKLFSTTTTLLAVMISSTMLLSACKDGSTGSSDRVLISNDGTSTTVKPTTKPTTGSDSSGKKDDKKDTPKKDEPTTKPHQLVGYWKAECDNHRGVNGDESELTYLKLTDAGNGLVLMDNTSINFEGRDCKGKSSPEYNGSLEPFDLDKEIEGSKITAIDDNSFKSVYKGKDSKEKADIFTRVTEKEYYDLVGKPEPIDETKAKKMLGNWKSNCQSNGRGSSSIEYINIARNDYNQFIVSMKEQDFSNEECKGDFELDKDNRVWAVEVMSDSLVTVTDTTLKFGEDGYYKEHTRISKAEFDAVK